MICKKLDVIQSAIEQIREAVLQIATQKNDDDDHKYPQNDDDRYRSTLSPRKNVDMFKSKPRSTLSPRQNCNMINLDHYKDVVCARIGSFNVNTSISMYSEMIQEGLVPPLNYRIEGECGGTTVIWNAFLETVTIKFHTTGLKKSDAKKNLYYDVLCYLTQ